MLGFSYPGQTYPAGYPFEDPDFVPPAVHHLARIDRVGRVPAERRRLTCPVEDRSLLLQQERRKTKVPGERRRLSVPGEDRRRRSK